ncbi:LysR family transcriptional regulator [Pseudochelatococcus sp. B33]
MPKLPPLSSIRAFESAARHLSFTKAAEELNVTQSAVSRHIRHIEDWLGVALFVRKPRLLVLTPEGERYKTELADIFQRMAWATERAARGKEILHIRSYTTFAMFWLIPRMKKFQDMHPHIDLQLTASTRPIDPEQERVHAVIRSGPGDFYLADRLFPMALMPVCSPAVQTEFLPAGDAAELVNAPLLHSVAAPSKWPTWLEGVGLRELDTSRSLRFESSAMALVAAEKGLGVSVAQPQFVQAGLRSGALVAPLPMIVEVSKAYYIACMPQHSRSAALRSFRDWILAETVEDREMLADIAGYARADRR